MLPNTAETVYIPLAYQARCTPTSGGTLPASFAVNLTATQYNACGQTSNLAVATNTTTVTAVPLTITAQSSSVCDTASLPDMVDKKTVVFTTTSTAPSLDGVTVAATGGVQCNAGTAARECDASG